VRGDFLKEAGSDPGDPVQPRQRAEWAACEAVGDDPPSEPRPHPGQPSQLIGAGPVHVDPFPRPQRPGEAPGAVALRGGVSGDEPAQGGDTARGVRRPAGAPAGEVPGDGEGEQREDGPVLGAHRPRLAPAPDRPASNARAADHFAARRMSAIATSPTTCRLAALTLSIVSRGVCHEG
jgi:hypothetical protein